MVVYNQNIELPLKAQAIVNDLNNNPKLNGVSIYFSAPKSDNPNWVIKKSMMSPSQWNHTKRVLLDNDVMFTEYNKWLDIKSEQFKK